MSDDHATYWRQLLGPANTELLIAEARADIDATRQKAAARGKRKDASVSLPARGKTRAPSLSESYTVAVHPDSVKQFKAWHPDVLDHEPQNSEGIR